MSLKSTIHITRLRAWLNRLSLPSLIQLEVVLLLTLICIGAYAFHLIEWWTLLDSLYFTVITVASVQVEMYENFELALSDLRDIQAKQNLEGKQIERLSALEESLVRQINLLRK